MRRGPCHLSGPIRRYTEYTRTVRAEYSEVSDRDFAQGRAQILRRLAAKPYLFHSRYARGHWEQQARADLDGELRALLRQRPDPG